MPAKKTAVDDFVEDALASNGYHAHRRFTKEGRDAEAAIREAVKEDPMYLFLLSTLSRSAKES